MNSSTDNAATGQPSAPGAVPVGYVEVLYWRLLQKRSRLLIMNLLALPLAAAFGALFFWLVHLFGRLAGDGGLPDLVWLLLGILLVMPLHELAHGAAMRLCGARPQYGILWQIPAFYATAPGWAFRRNHYLIICLAPLMSLSLLASVGIFLLAGSPNVWVPAVCGFVNGSGVSGDLWISLIVLRYPPEAYVIDERDGMRIFMPAVS